MAFCQWHLCDGVLTSIVVRSINGLKTNVVAAWHLSGNIKNVVGTVILALFCNGLGRRLYPADADDSTDSLCPSQLSVVVSRPSPDLLFTSKTFERLERPEPLDRLEPSLSVCPEPFDRPKPLQSFQLCGRHKRLDHPSNLVASAAAGPRRM